MSARTGNRIVTLLLIDDDDVDVMSVERSFARQRVNNPILRARHGQEALEMLRKGQVSAPFIILLDLQMPRMNGLEFLSQLRRDPVFGSSVVFVLTTSKAEDDIIASFQKHIAGYFIKDEAANGILSVVALLDGYSRISELPPAQSIVRRAD